MIYLIKDVFPNKTEDLSLSVFNTITAINETKALTKHISCECNCKFDGKNVSQIKSEIAINVIMSVKSKKKKKKIKFGILLHGIVKVENTLDNSVITCDEVIESYNEEIKTIPTNFNEKIELLKYKVSKFYVPFY